MTRLSANDERPIVGGRHARCGEKLSPETAKLFDILYVVAMVAVVVGVDVAFFKDHFWERLAASVGIVLVFVAFYFRFLKR